MRRSTRRVHVRSASATLWAGSYLAPNLSRCQRAPARRTTSSWLQLYTFLMRRAQKRLSRPRLHKGARRRLLCKPHRKVAMPSRHSTVSVDLPPRMHQNQLTAGSGASHERVGLGRNDARHAPHSQDGEPIWANHGRRSSWHWSLYETSPGFM